MTILSLMFCMMYSNHTVAATFYWIATTSSNWNNISNWSFSSGGSSSTYVPGEFDYVRFDNNGNGNCNIDATVLVRAIWINGYNGTISQGSYNMTTTSSGYYIQTSGTFTGGSATFTCENDFEQSGGTFTAGSATIDINADFTLSGGTFNAPSGNMYVKNDWTHTAGGTFNHNSGTVNFDASSNTYLDVSSSETFFNLTLNKSTASNFCDVANNDILIILGTLAYTTGYFNVHGSSYLDARGNVSMGTLPFNNQMPIKFTGSANQTFTLTSSYDQFDADITINKSAGYSVSLASNLILNHSNQDLTITSGTLDLNGNTLTVSGSGGTFIVQSGGELKLQGGESCSTPTLNNGSSVYYTGSGGPYTIKNVTYKDITLNGGASSTFNLPANLTVDGDLTITQGILDATTSNYDLTINGDWSNSGTFTARAGTVTFNTAGTQDISGTTTFYDLTCNSTDLNLQGNTTVSNNLVINSSKVLSVDPGKSLTVSGTLTNSGGNAGLVLNSDATGTASLITASSVSGTAKRYVTGGSLGSASGINHYVTMPVSSGTGASLIDASLGNFNVYTYTSNAFVRVFSGDNLTVGKGYIVSYNANKTISFTGTLNTGDYTSVPISSTNNDWNLIGNPYPCAITASSFITENVTTNSNYLQGTLYFWNQTSTFNGGDYASHNGSGGTAATNGGSAPDGNIGTGQAFFVKSGSGSGSVCHFHNSMKTTTNTQFFVPDPITVQRFYLNVTDEKDNFNQILLGFLEPATESFDVLYDGEKLQGNPDLSLYSKIKGDDKNYVIQGLSLLTKTVSVPIGLYAGVGGKYTFELDRLEDFDPAASIYLEDKLTQKLIDLNEKSVYRFHTNKGEINDRFVLHFNPEINTSADLPIASPIQIYSSGNSIHLFNPDGKSFKVEIYDLLGKNVYSADFQKERQSVQLQEAIGYYVVKVSDGSSSYLEKVFLTP